MEEWSANQGRLERRELYCLGACESRMVWRIGFGLATQVQHTRRGVRQLGSTSCRGMRRIKLLFRSLRRFNALKFLAGLEADRFAGRNVDFLAGAGIAADAGLARLDAKDSEAAQLNALAAAESDLQGLENGLNGLLRLCTADTRRGDDGVYDLHLNHPCLPTRSLPRYSSVSP